MVIKASIPSKNAQSQVPASMPSPFPDSCSDMAQGASTNAIHSASYSTCTNLSSLYSEQSAHQKDPLIGFSVDPEKMSVLEYQQSSSNIKGNEASSISFSAVSTVRIESTSYEEKMEKSEALRSVAEKQPVRKLESKILKATQRLKDAQITILSYKNKALSGHSVSEEEFKQCQTASEHLILYEDEISQLQQIYLEKTGKNFDENSSDSEDSEADEIALLSSSLVGALNFRA